MLEDRSSWGGALPARYAFLPSLWLALMVASFGAAVSAQSSGSAGAAGTAVRSKAESLPSARSILDRHLEAIGGRAAVLRHSSTVQRGTLSMPKAGVSGELVVYRAKPNKSVVKVTLSGVGEVIEAFDGVNGWSHTPMTGPMLLEGKQLADRKFDSDYFVELHDESRYTSISTVEQTDFEGRPCYKVRFVRTTGTEDFEFYDVATGLKAGGITTRETPMGTITGTSVESEYRKFGDVLYPTIEKIRMAGIEQVVTITSVEHDNVPPSVFEMPADIKALIK